MACLLRLDVSYATPYLPTATAALRSRVTLRRRPLRAYATAFLSLINARHCTASRQHISRAAYALSVSIVNARVVGYRARILRNIKRTLTGEKGVSLSTGGERRAAISGGRGRACCYRT